MSIQWMDNFGSYGQNEVFLLNGPYAMNEGTLEVDPDPTAGGSICYFVAGNSIFPKQTLRKVLLSTEATVGVAFRIWLTALPSDTAMCPMVQFNDVFNGNLLSLTVNPTGALSLSLNGVNSSPGTLIEATTGPVLITNAWQHVEIKATINTVTGAYEIRIEGVPVLDGTGANTKGTGSSDCAIIGFANKPNGVGAGVGMYIKDLVIYDGNGAYNNDFIGSVSVFRLVPNVDTTLGGWTTSSGATGYNLIDESPPVDGGYVQADATPPAACEFGLTNLPADVTSVRGLMTFVRAAKTDGGDATLQVSVGSDGDYDNGSDRPITTAFTYYADICEEDPATTAPWLPSAVNAATLVLDRTT